jgi:mRNA-degrading endonuclease RelE of RelBE toxin-antitoxin system
MRIGNFRVFYNVDKDSRVVEVKAVMLKDGSKLVARGKEIQL